MEAPWCGLQAPEVDLACLVKYVKDNRIGMLYEFGSGVSTQRLAEAGVSVVSFETHKPYADAVREYFKELRLDPMPTISSYEESSDFMSSLKHLAKARLCFVDGPRGTKQMSRINSLKAAAILADTILLHDAQRRGERQSLEYMKGQGWNVSYLPGAVKPKKIALLVRA